MTAEGGPIGGSGACRGVDMMGRQPIIHRMRGAGGDPEERGQVHPNSPTKSRPPILSLLSLALSSPSSMLPSNPSPSRPPAQPSPLRFSSTPFDSASHETPAAPPKPAKRSYDESTAADPSIPTIRVPTPSPPPEPAASKRSRTSVKASKARADDDDDDDATQGYKSSRQVGTTSLPIARVSKIMKADKDLNGSAKDAVFLIAVATVSVIHGPHSRC